MSSKATGRVTSMAAAGGALFFLLGAVFFIYTHGSTPTNSEGTLGLGLHTFSSSPAEQ